jgi:hypothetical protein
MKEKAEMLLKDEKFIAAFSKAETLEAKQKLFADKGIEFSIKELELVVGSRSIQKQVVSADAYKQIADLIARRA